MTGYNPSDDISQKPPFWRWYWSGVKTLITDRVFWACIVSLIGLFGVMFIFVVIMQVIFGR